MSLRWPSLFVILPVLILAAAQPEAQVSSSSRHHADKSVAETSLDPGSVSTGAYRNKSLGLTCKIPEGWVLRTDEMNPNGNDSKDAVVKSSPSDPRASSSGAKVLLAVFSRPPEAKGEEVNSSILIAAEPAADYPGLTDPVQYFGPLTEVAQAQGFTAEEDPYEVAIGPQKLVRADFHKDVGTRVMWQSTLAMLSHGYAVSITVIAGTTDDVEQLMNGLDFRPSARSLR